MERSNGMLLSSTEHLRCYGRRAKYKAKAIDSMLRSKVV